MMNDKYYDDKSDLGYGSQQSSFFSSVEILPEDAGSELPTKEKEALVYYKYLLELLKEGTITKEEFIERVNIAANQFDYSSYFKETMIKYGLLITPAQR